MAEDFTDGGGTGSVTVNYLGTVSITKFGLQAGTDRTVFVTWKWNGLYTKEYRVIWYYYTGNGVAFVGNDSTTTSKQSSYSAPSNATSVSVKIKPISQTRKVNGHDILWWTATWSTLKNYSFANNPPSTSTINRGREIVHRVTDPQFSGEPTDRQIKDYATSLLSQLSSVEYTISYSHGYCPVRLYDCVRLNYERAGLIDIKAKVTRQSIECKPGCKVTETAVFTTKLWR